MKHVLLALVAIPALAIGGAWLIWREFQWHHNRTWRGHYDQPVEGWRMAEHAEDGTEYIPHDDPRWAA